MTARLRTFVQILMAVLALGMGPSQPVCAAVMPEPGPGCCCGDCPSCKLHPSLPCTSSCHAAQVQTLDKQSPARMGTARYSGGSFLFFLAPVLIKYPAYVSVVRRRDLNASPPFGGSPPQAVLRLWLI